MVYFSVGTAMGFQITSVIIGALLLLFSLISLVMHGRFSYRDSTYDAEGKYRSFYACGNNMYKIFIIRQENQYVHYTLHYTYKYLCLLSPICTQKKSSVIKLIEFMT